MQKLLFVLLIGLLFGACKNGENSSESETIAVDTCIEKTEEQLLEEWSNQNISVFGVVTKCNPKDILEDLSKAGVLKVDSITYIKEDYISRYEGNTKLRVDTIRYKNERLRSAIVEFAGVKFGLNVKYRKEALFSFLFISSVPIDQTYKPLKNAIMKYYGEPYDDDNESMCNWDAIVHDNLWVRFRPLRSEEGGTVMMWDRFFQCQL